MTIENGLRPSTTSAPSRVSRRTLVAGTAWAVPAVVVSSAAPAMAASPASCTYQARVYQAGQLGSCRIPGGTVGSAPVGYRLFFNVYRDISCDNGMTTVSLSIAAANAQTQTTQVTFTSAFSTQATTPPVTITTPTTLQSVVVTLSVGGRQAGQPVTVPIPGDITTCTV